jgi:hydrogenase maturation protease
MTNPPITLIVGIGSAHGDDQIGWLLADALTKMLADHPPSRTIMVHKAKSPIDLLNWLDEKADANIQRLLICDACHGLGVPGTSCRWNWPNSELDNVRFSGSHDFGLTAVLQLAQSLGRLPPDVTVWGTQIEQARPGTGLSPQLSGNPFLLARQMLQSIEELQGNGAAAAPALEM